MQINKSLKKKELKKIKFKGKKKYWGNETCGKNNMNK